MNPTAREVARRVLRRVEGEGAYATLALAGELGRAELAQADRGLATELTYGVLRTRRALEARLERHAPKGIPDPRSPAGPADARCSAGRRRALTSGHRAGARRRRRRNRPRSAPGGGGGSTPRSDRAMRRPTTTPFASSDEPP